MRTLFKSIGKVRRALIKKGNATGSGMALAGFALSPLSPWNDVYINFPIAYAGASITSLVSQNLFDISLILFYWLSNFAGLILLELGVETVLHKNKHLTRTLILLDILVSLGITAVLVYLMHLGFIKSPAELFA